MSTLARLINKLPRALREPIIRSRVRIDEAEIARFTAKVASEEAEYEAAARLVHDCYVKRGILEHHPTGIRVTPHQLLPSTIVFVVKDGDEVIATMSLIPDSRLGLPMEATYADEIGALRRQGRFQAEVGALCVAPGRRRVGVSYLLNRLMYDTARALGVDDLVIAVHPESGPLYQAAIGFETIGPVRTYDGLNKQALAVALRLDLRTAREVWFQRFGHRPLTGGNPYWLYVARENPQNETPTFDSIATAEDARRRGAAILLAKRPDCLHGLSAQSRALLEAAASQPLLQRPAPRRATTVSPTRRATTGLGFAGA